MLLVESSVTGEYQNASVQKLFSILREKNNVPVFTLYILCMHTDSPTKNDKMARMQVSHQWGVPQQDPCKAKTYWYYYDIFVLFWLWLIVVFFL